MGRMNLFGRLLFIIAAGLSTCLQQPTMASLLNDTVGLESLIGQPWIDRVELIEPDSASQVNSSTPTFRWRAVAAKSQVNYRLLIAKTDGRVVVDQWLGSDTSFTISSSNLIEDLTLYNWMIYALVGDRQLHSPIWSFWVDQNKVTDLNVTRLLLVSPKEYYLPGDDITVRVTVQNSGPVAARGAYVVLYSGNPNSNYVHFAAFRKTVILDTAFVAELPVGISKTLELTAKLPAGYNRLFVRVEPAPGFRDVIAPNNFATGIVLQTNPRRLVLRALFVIYSQFLDPGTGLISLDEADQRWTPKAITNLQQYVWDHTHAIEIQADTLNIDRLLNIRDFNKKDDAWGLYISPRSVQADLINRQVKFQNYDILIVLYCWWNSKVAWSGYAGYIFRDMRSLKQKPAIIAQPIIPGQPANETILIHEFLHFLDNRYEDFGERRFYSPHHRILYTTFDRDEDYYQWILETWPTEAWFQLKAGQIITAPNMTMSVVSRQQKQHALPLALSQNYPNPFNTFTTIHYHIPALDSSVDKISVRLVIYDLSGKVVSTLVDQYQRPGTYSINWDGTDLHGNPLPSGIYFYRLQVAEHRQAKKMLLIR